MNYVNLYDQLDSFDKCKIIELLIEDGYLITEITDESVGVEDSYFAEALQKITENRHLVSVEHRDKIIKIARGI